MIKTLNDQAINKLQQCMFGSQSGNEKNIPQLMFQYAFKLIFYQLFSTFQCLFSGIDLRLYDKFESESGNHSARCSRSYSISTEPLPG